MGIKGLLKFVKERIPSAISVRHISAFRYKKICLDTFCYLYRYKAVYGNDFLTAFYNLIKSLRNYRIHFIPIFDGKPPIEKQVTMEKRHESRKQAGLRIEILRKSDY